jgi:hypothetical protein
MKLTKLSAVAGVVLVATVVALFATTHQTSATPSSAADIVLGPALSTPHLSADVAIQRVKDQGAAPLFDHASQIVTHFGSRTPPVKLNGASLPTKDYWTVHVIGLKPNSNGQPLLMYHGSPDHPAPPSPSEVTFVVDDQTGLVVEVDY